jgi:uncharacterized protein (TIGR02466 family)
MSDTLNAFTPAQVKALLQQALDHLNRNELSQAEAALSRVLANFPADPGALQFMGLIRRAQSQFGEAEELYRRSLAVRPEQPHVRHNLGNLLAVQGRNEEAAAEQRAAIALKHNYIEAHLMLGHALRAQGAFAEAERSYRNALRIQPSYVFAKQSLAVVLMDTGRVKDAETLLRQTLALGIDDKRQVAALEHNLGVALKMQQRNNEALALFDAAQTKVPDMPLVDYNRAGTLQQMNRLEEAMFCHQRALTRNPLHMEAHRDLNQVLYRLERDHEFLRSYDDAMALYPDIGALALDKADFLFRVEKFDEAAELYARAARLLPQHVTPHDGLALTHARARRFADAIREHETVLKLEPENAPAWCNYAQTLLRAGEPKQSLKAAEQALAITPTNQLAIALMGLAQRAMGDTSEAALNDTESLVQIFDLDPPQGYADMESFNRDLNASLDGLHIGKREYLDQTQRGGTQTLGDLFAMGHPLIEKLRPQIDKAVGAYIAGMKDDANHPLFQRRAKGFEISGSWSTRLHDGGFHLNHVHPTGWISAVYYVDVPDAVQNEAAREGWLKFGEPSFDAGIKDPVRRVVKPVPGQLVLFPSYMWHGTVPFHSSDTRTTIAFDIVPR